MPIEKIKDLEEGASSVVFTARYKKRIVVVKHRKKTWKGSLWAKELKVLNVLKAEPCRDIFLFYGETKILEESAFLFEYLEGGDLFAAMHKEIGIVTFNEDIVRVWARCLLRALAWIHARGILHRDVKTENLLLTEPIGPSGKPAKSSRIKLIDFGCATVLEEGMNSNKGEYNTIDCAPYEAADIVDGACMRQSDIHPAGEVLFQLFEGFPAFECPTHENGKKLLPKVRFQKKREILVARKPGEQDLPFKRTPEGARGLITAMLMFDAEDRPSAEQLLGENPWLQFGEAEEELEMLAEAEAGKLNAKPNIARRISSRIGSLVDAGKERLKRSGESQKEDEAQERKDNKK